MRVWEEIVLGEVLMRGENELGPQAGTTASTAVLMHVASHSAPMCRHCRVIV